MTIEELKFEAAKEAVKDVKSNMIVGLGTGSTANFAIKIIAEKYKNGEIQNIKCISSSTNSEILAKELGLPVISFDEVQQIDVTIDGADEVDENLNIIKGGGGALLREKILAQASKTEIIIVDSSKTSKLLGEKWALPVEVIRFSYKNEKKYIESLGATVTLRLKNGIPFITDEGNYIIDCNFGVIPSPDKLADLLNKRAGIVEHGLFINLCSKLIIAKEDGIVVKNK